MTKTIAKNPFEIKGQCFTGQDFKTAITERRLLEAEFNVSPTCNLDCSFCYTGSNEQRGYCYTSIKDTDTFLRQVSEAGAKTIRIVGIGEPFLDKRIFDGQKFPFLDLAQQHGITSVIYTNGTLINEKLAQRLTNYDVSLVTKLYSFSPHDFEEMTGNKGFFTQDKQVNLIGEKYIPRSLEILIEDGFNQSFPTRLGINNVITSQNIGELEIIYQFARFNNLAIRFSAFLYGLRNFDKPAKSEDLLEEYKKLSEWEERFSGFRWQPYGEIVGGGCSRLGFNITLHGENFKICAGEDSYLKNEKGDLLTIHNTSVKEIVESHPLFERMRKVRKERETFRCVMSENILNQLGGKNEQYPTC